MGDILSENQSLKRRIDDLKQSTTNDEQKVATMVGQNQRRISELEAILTKKQVYFQSLFFHHLTDNQAELEDTHLVVQQSESAMESLKRSVQVLWIS